MKRDTGKVGNDNVAGNFLGAAFPGEVLNVTESLRFRFAEVFAKSLVLDEHDARPEQVDVTVFAGDSLYRLFKAGDGAPLDAEDVKKFIPESLFLGSFALDARPFLREGDSAMADFVPGQGHGCMIAKTEECSDYGLLKDYRA